MHCEISAPSDGKQVLSVFPSKQAKDSQRAFWNETTAKQVHPAENPGRIQDQFLDELCRYVLKATKKGGKKPLKLIAVKLSSGLQRFCV